MSVEEIDVSELIKSQAFNLSGGIKDIPLTGDKVVLVCELHISPSVIVGLNTIEISKRGDCKTYEKIHGIPVNDTGHVPVIFSLCLVKPEVDVFSVKSVATAH